jgi:hypothetical protein
MSDSNEPGAQLRAAWERYRAAQEEIRKLTENTPRFKSNPRDRAKAYHALFEAMAMAYNQSIAPRMYQPRILTNTAWHTDVYTLGQNGPDLYYATAYLDGKMDYKLKVRFGDLVYVLAQVVTYQSGHPDSKVFGNHELSNFRPKDDGTVEFIFSATQKPGNWLPLYGESAYNMVLFRRFLKDPSDDHGEFRIERITPLPRDYYDADEFDEAAMVVRIDRAIQFMKYLVQYFNIGLYDFYVGNAGEKNKMRFLPRTATSEIASPSSNYAMAIYSLQDDEALLIELDTVPDGIYWGFQTGNVWSRSLDVRHSQTNLNMTQLAVDKDGAVRVVISRRDPGIRNWLDTTGYQEGTVVFRNYRTELEPVPKTTKLKFADLHSNLPRDTARVTPEERAQSIAQRGDGMWRLYGE